MTSSFAGWITACVAHYQCHRYVRRAVESLLRQSYPWIRVVIINDGDPVPPWRELASITDPRLLRFTLKENRGSFFCSEIARRASPDPYFMIQDADDWAAPNRAASLLSILRRSNSALAVSAQPQFCETPHGIPYQIAVRWDRMSNAETSLEFVVQNTLTKRFLYRAPHAGLIRMSALSDVGGYYGGFRVGWDTLLTNVLMMIGSITWTPERLYYRLVRDQSLTHSSSTGVNSAYASAVSNCLRELYDDCYKAYCEYRAERMLHSHLASYIQAVCSRYVTPADQSALTFYTQKLRNRMTGEPASGICTRR